MAFGNILKITETRRQLALALFPALTSLIPYKQLKMKILAVGRDKISGYFSALHNHELLHGKGCAFILFL
jgi:hypothetical protein